MMKINKMKTKILNNEKVNDEELHQILQELFYEADYPRECELKMDMEDTDNYFKNMIQLLDKVIMTLSDYGIRAYDSEEVTPEMIKQMVDILDTDNLIKFIKGADRNNIILVDYEDGDEVHVYDGILDAYTDPLIVDMIVYDEHAQEERDKIMKLIKTFFTEE